MIMEYKKLYKSFKQMTGTAASKCDDCDADSDEHCDDIDEIEGIESGLQQLGYQKYVFSEEHPGCKYSHLSKLVLSVIPKVSLPRGRLCHIKDLDINLDSPSEDTVECRENYAENYSTDVLSFQVQE